MALPDSALHARNHPGSCPSFFPFCCVGGLNPGLYTEQMLCHESHPPVCAELVHPFYASIFLVVTGILGTRAHRSISLTLQEAGVRQDPSAFAGPAPWVCGGGMRILLEEAGPACILQTTLLAAPPPLASPLSAGRGQPCRKHFPRYFGEMKMNEMTGPLPSGCLQRSLLKQSRQESQAAHPLVQTRSP